MSSGLKLEGNRKTYMKTHNRKTSRGNIRRKAIDHLWQKAIKKKIIENIKEQ